MHLRAALSAGAAALTWQRRTRIDGDSWESPEVPLGEAREAYVLRILDGPAVRREVEVTAPGFTYTAAMRAADGTAAGFDWAVAQLSDSFGPGPFRSARVG